MFSIRIPVPNSVRTIHSSSFERVGVAITAVAAIPYWPIALDTRSSICDSATDHSAFSARSLIRTIGRNKRSSVSTALYEYRPASHIQCPFTSPLNRGL